MIIGILYEGKLDEDPIIILIERIVGFRPVLIPYRAGGTILSKLSAASEYFFDVKEADFAVFQCDIDKDISRRRKINRWIKESGREDNIIAAFANPSFEQWLICEENTVKQYFNLAAAQPLPHPLLHPKERLGKIFSENNTDITKIVKDFYIEITNLMDLNVLASRDKDFRNFRAGLARVRN